MPFDGQNFDTKPDLSDLMDDEILRTLVEADALLSDESKWCKYARQDDRGALCVHGAIAVAITGCAESDSSLEDDVAAHIYRACGDMSPDITRSGCAWFNNADSTTFADVKALFARAIEERARALRGS